MIVFTGLHSFHMLSCYSFIPKWIQFTSKFYTQHPTMTRWKQSLCKILVNLLIIRTKIVNPLDWTWFGKPQPVYIRFHSCQCMLEHKQKCRRPTRLYRGTDLGKTTENFLRHWRSQWAEPPSSSNESRFHPPGLFPGNFRYFGAVKTILLLSVYWLFIEKCPLGPSVSVHKL